jgi:hypothetical protein
MSVIRIVVMQKVGQKYKPRRTIRLSAHFFRLKALKAAG